MPGVLRRGLFISGRLLPSHALPPTIYYKYIFYFEGGSSSVTTAGTGRYRSRVLRKCIVGAPAGGQGSKAVGVACFESTNWVRMPR
jgi:hypothetical protein